jgi:hypothetical protein
MRVILISLAHVIGQPSRSMTMSMPCAVIEYLHESFPGTRQNPYPSCSAYVLGENLLQEAFVTTNWDLNDLPGITAALRVGYAVGGWLGFLTNAIGIEIYVSSFSVWLIRILTWGIDMENGAYTESKGLMEARRYRRI